MSRVLLGLGSNIDPAYHLPLGLTALDELLRDVRCSCVYEGEAQGFVGDPFWNLVLEGVTDLAVADLQKALRNIEYAYGRPVDAPRFSSRALDIDILIFGELVGEHAGVELPRGEILDVAFVLRPLAELVPEAVHPLVGKSYATLWHEFDQESQPLRRVRFEDGSS